MANINNHKTLIQTHILIVNTIWHILLLAVYTVKLILHIYIYIYNYALGRDIFMDLVRNHNITCSIKFFNFITRYDNWFSENSMIR